MISTLWNSVAKFEKKPLKNKVECKKPVYVNFINKYKKSNWKQDEMIGTLYNSVAKLKNLTKIRFLNRIRLIISLSKKITH